MIEKFKLNGTVDDYALVYQKSDRLKEFKIVTEKEKRDMNAKIIELQDSPAVTTKKILQKIADLTLESKEVESTMEELKEVFR